MNNRAPIGIFDSGVGGLSVMHHIQLELPGECLVYVADSRYAPYGDKSEAEVVQRSLLLSEFLLGIGVKALVVACNTATAAAITQLRNRFALPIIGMEPALKPAVSSTTTGVVGILATSGTLNSSKFENLNVQFGQNVKVIAQGCPGLVEQIELGEFDSDKTYRLVRDYVSRLVRCGVDTIVLGCTHYPLLKTLIQRVAGPDIEVIDTGKAVAKQLARRLAEGGLLLDSSHRGSIEFWSSSSSERTCQTIARLYRTDILLRSLPC